MSLAHTLHLQAVAEGVETRAQADSLAELGCDLAQGYYLARPMSSEAIEELLRLEPAPAVAGELSPAAVS